MSSCPSFVADWTSIEGLVTRSAVSLALQEHIEYLSIKGRYELFDAAFEKVICDGDVVADLGCGVGVLGLQCLKRGAGHVFGIDSSEAIHLARETMERAGLGERYTCFAQSTFDTELSEPVDAIVCDHIGYFGFDYGLIDLIRDSALRMLRPGGAIVPDRIKLLVAGASSPRLRAVASSWTADCIPAEFHWLDEQNRNSKFGLQISSGEICSSAPVVGEITLDANAPKFFSFETELLIEKAGIFDGVVGWFDCHLGADEWMTNSPIEDRAITRPQAFLPAKEPFTVAQNDKIGVTLRFNSSGEVIAWTILPPEGGVGKAHAQSLSTFNSTVLSPRDLSMQMAAPLSLTKQGEARAFVLSLVNGKRSRSDIIGCALKERPDLFPSEAAFRDFVERVTKRDCITD